jgi:hypothetical protein
MDDEELQYALELKHKKDDEDQADSDIAGVIEEGSFYDSEEELKELQKQKK